MKHELMMKGACSTSLAVIQASQNAVPKEVLRTLCNRNCTEFPGLYYVGLAGWVNALSGFKSPNVWITKCKRNGARFILKSYLVYWCAEIVQHLLSQMKSKIVLVSISKHGVFAWFSLFCIVFFWDQAWTLCGHICFLRSAEIRWLR